MLSIRRARRLLRHRPGRLSWALGMLLALSWLITISAAPFLPRQHDNLQQAALLQQDTPTPSPTASISPTPSPSLTPSLSATLTLTSTTVTATITLTGSPAASFTATLTPPPDASPTLTLTPPPAVSATWTLPYPSPIPPTTTVPGVLPSPTEAGPTATLIPLPTVTYQFPGVTPRGDLLALAQPTAVQVLPKGQSPLALRLPFGRGWLLFFLVILWGGLVAWFVVAQIIARRQ